MAEDSQKFAKSMLSLLAAARNLPPDEINDKYRYPIQAPKLPRGVAPEGVQAPVMAQDSYSLHGFMGDHVHVSSGFPGYPKLALLATMPEYRAMAESLSTELTREWINIKAKQEDPDDAVKEKISKIVERFEELKLLEVIQTAAAHDAYYGRAQIFFDIRGADEKTPLILSPRTITQGSLISISTIEPIWSTPSAYNTLRPAAKDFYKPSEWFVMGVPTHASRLQTIITRPVSDMLKPAYNFSGMSLSQLAEPYVDNWLRTRQSVADLVSNFSTTALATDMASMLQVGCDDDSGGDLMNRAQLFTLLRSNKGLMLIDKNNEELVQLNVPLSGLSDLQAQAQEHMCSVSRIPAIVLTGISPSGLNATSEGEIRVFYDWIAAQQRRFWFAPINVALQIVQLDMFGAIDPNIMFEFNPLYQMTPKELAEIREINSRTDGAYIENGVITTQEVREAVAVEENSRYSGVDTGVEPGLETGGLPALLDPNFVPPANDPIATADKSVSPEQHRAMEAAAHGTSTLGIPESVGKEFVSKDA